jgi:hypothetical protein
VCTCILFVLFLAGVKTKTSDELSGRQSKALKKKKKLSKGGEGLKTREVGRDHEVVRIMLSRCC